MYLCACPLPHTFRAINSRYQQNPMSIITTSTNNTMSGEEPCTACTWTPERQRSCLYPSQLCLFYAVSTRGVWSLGSQFILKDRESYPPDYEIQNTRFLQTLTTIPLPQTVLAWDEPEKKRSLRIVKRIDGITLEEAWPQLSETE
jgi:hypothetical protein